MCKDIYSKHINLTFRVSSFLFTFLNNGFNNVSLPIIVFGQVLQDRYMEKGSKVAIYLFDAKHDHVGLGEFENSLAKEIVQHAPLLKEKYNIQLFFIVSKEKMGAYGMDVEYILLDKWRKRLLNNRFTSALFPFLFPKVDLVHWSHQTPLINRCLSPYTLITVHDVNFFHNDLSMGKTARKARRIGKRLAKATHLAFISNFTQKDVNAHFPIKIPTKVILNGVTDQSCLQEEVIMPQIPEKFFLHVSRLAAKKNVHLLVEMMKYLPDENLVLAGKGRSPYEQRLKKIIEENHLTNVYLLGSVTAEEKAALYRKCKAFLFPSLSEGFGLPVVEAMCFGKPAFISDRTSLPEIGGDAAYYFTELRPDKMAEVIAGQMPLFEKDRECLETKIKQHAAQFSWKKAANEYISYYLDILGLR